MGKLVLQEAQVDIIPLELCNEYNWYGGRITFNMVCAGSASGHVDSCQVKLRNFQLKIIFQITFMKLH